MDFEMGIYGNHESEFLVCSWILLVIICNGFVVGSECDLEGENVFYNCTVDREPGLLVWSGDGFVCSSSQSITNNQIALITSTQCSTTGAGECNDYNATIRCTGEASLTSTLFFNASRSMDGFNINCIHREVLQTNITLRVGVTPNPPWTVNLTFPDHMTCVYVWVPPNTTTIGGIRGYSLNYTGDCGTCFPPEGVVNNDTFTATCSGWFPYGQTCIFEVRTVTEDCGFESTPGIVRSILDNTNATNITASLICAEGTNSPTIHIEWNYIPPGVNDTIIPGVLGFEVIISDDQNNAVVRFLNDSEIRSYDYNQTSDTSLIGANRNIGIAVVTEIGNRTSVPTTLSVEPTTTDIAPTLTEMQCIDVIVNSNCNESANSFRAQVEYKEGSCDPGNDNPTTRTDNYTLSKDYTACVQVEPYSVCFFARVFYDDIMVGITNEEQLVLSQCNVSSLDRGPGVSLNTTDGEVTTGSEVLHNTMIELLCENMGCTFNGTNQTRCVNGTFNPPVTGASCICPSPTELSTGEIVGIVVAVVLVAIGLIILAIIVGFIIYCVCKGKCGKKQVEVSTSTRTGPAELYEVSGEQMAQKNDTNEGVNVDPEANNAKYKPQKESDS